MSAIRLVTGLHSVRQWSSVLVFGLLGFWVSACRSVPVARMPLTTADMVHRSGQAAWTPGRGAGAVVVDLEIWTRADGSCVLDVSKAGLPFLMAQVTPHDWRIDASDGRRHSGRGAPPVRVGWLQLARTLGGQVPASKWEREQLEPKGWRLKNRRTGEGWDGVIFP